MPGQFPPLGYTPILGQDINSQPAIKKHIAQIATTQILSILHFFFLKSRMQIPKEDIKKITITIANNKWPL